jgi:predicted aldo/keto reductase-like oxidoreductase
MNRREFLGALAVGAIVAPALASDTFKGIPARVLGRTGLRVPILGFGSGSRFLMYKEEDKALEALNRALDLGVCYVDTAQSYGNGKSEEWIGHLMTTRRKEVVLATKIPGRTAEEGRRQIEESLERLKTDRVDVLHIHALKDADDLKAIEARGGVLEALLEAREQKVTRAIGITCHANPQALRDALERHDFDCTQMALNAGLARMADTPKGMKATPERDGSFEKLALPVAVRKGMGIIAMKVFGQEQLLGGSASLGQLLSYSLSLPVAMASVGMPKLEHIEHNSSLVKEFKPLNEAERLRISHSIESSRKQAMLRFFREHEDV